MHAASFYRSSKAVNITSRCFLQNAFSLTSYTSVSRPREKDLDAGVDPRAIELQKNTDKIRPAGRRISLTGCGKKVVCRGLRAFQPR